MKTKRIRITVSDGYKIEDEINNVLQKNNSINVISIQEEYRSGLYIIIIFFHIED